MIKTSVCNLGETNCLFGEYLEVDLIVFRPTLPVLTDHLFIYGIYFLEGNLI